MQTIVITGASDGIGAASARQLKALGHQVVIVGRSRAKTEAIARELNCPFHLVDYMRLSDVKRLATELNQYERIDVLANNAGSILASRELTEDGFEKTFQVNHLASFLLTKLLLKKLIESRAKVIQTASIAANMYAKNFDINNLNLEREYTPKTAYGYGKLENILFTRELDRRHRADGISAVAFHPGIVRTNFASDSTHLWMRLMYQTLLKYLAYPFTISAETSANRLKALVVGKPGVDWQPGEVYNKSKPMPVSFKDDGTVARSLWEQSERFVEPFLEN